ncbi:hypothetical protein MRX96_000537 [Rhipicephalus microplus]
MYVYLARNEQEEKRRADWFLPRISTWPRATFCSAAPREQPTRAQQRASMTVASAAREACNNAPVKLAVTGWNRCCRAGLYHKGGACRALIWAATRCAV